MGFITIPLSNAKDSRSTCFIRHISTKYSWLQCAEKLDITINPIPHPLKIPTPDDILKITAIIEIAKEIAKRNSANTIIYADIEREHENQRFPPMRFASACT